MREKMRFVLNKFFTPRHKDEGAKLLRKIWAFLEKINHLLFFRFYDCGPFDGGAVVNISNVFLINTALLNLLYLRLLFVVKCFLLNFNKMFSGARKVRAHSLDRH